MTPFAHAESARRWPSEKVIAPPVIDGDLADATWAALKPGEGFVDILSQEPSQFKTEVWLGYDAKAVYVAFRCSHPDPSQIVAREVLPGASFANDDHVTFAIDPFNARSGFESLFRVNAIGTQTEVIGGGRAEKREWRGRWKAATKRWEGGYTVEMEIPWAILDRPQGTRDLSINFERRHAAIARTDVWNEMGRPAQPENEALWQGVQLPAGTSDRKPQILAYGLLEGRQDPSFERLRVGLDAKVKLSSTMTGIGTLYPDFQNIEQQVEAVGFTRTERYQSDRRPFFAEGDQYFNVMTGGGMGSGFYSRRIREIDSAAKVYGQLNPNTQLGAFAALSPDNEFNFVGKVQRTFAGQGAVSAFATAHQDENRKETLMGMAGTKRFGNFSLSGQLGRLNRVGDDASAYQMSGTLKAPNLSSLLSYRSVPTNYRPYLGFASFVGFAGPLWVTSYALNPTKGALESYGATSTLIDDRQFDGKVQQRGVQLDMFASLRSFHTFSMTYASVQFPDATDRILATEYSFSRRDPYNSLSLGYSTGARGTQSTRSYSAGIRRRPIKNLDLGLSWYQEEFGPVASQMIGTASWQFDPKRSLSARLVRNGTQTNSYLAYREAGFAGSEIYVILGDPNAPSFRSRLAVKWVMPIGF
ncbi:MAG: hypothetical protein JNJ45_03230 [Chthonomonas sp.]|nr:hypothetical protein [Chthonomonas sp.]